MGKLMVIDGLDGSGKSTQLDLLTAYWEKQNRICRHISFPDYDQPSSALVKMYLGGELGGSPSAVNAYAASSFYAVDRYASFKKFWQEDYEKNIPIVAARYTTSNAIHQMTKLPQNQWDAYLEWLAEYEYDRLDLPRPDCVVFLDMNPVISQKLLKMRYNGDEQKKDIHERDFSYLLSCREAALYVGKKWNWHIIPCDDGENPRSIEAISVDLIKVFDDFYR